MGWVTVTLAPGVNVELTAAALQSGYSASSCIRFKSGMAQKIGGWTRYCPTNLQGYPRHSHSWEDLANNSRLAVGTTARVYDYTNSTLTDISPQILVTNPTIDFTTTIGSPIVTVTDTAVDTITPYNSVFFNTPVSIDGIILSGFYPVTAYISATSLHHHGSLEWSGRCHRRRGYSEIHNGIEQSYCKGDVNRSRAGGGQRYRLPNRNHGWRDHDFWTIYHPDHRGFR